MMLTSIATHRIISSGFHWIKLITWFKIGQIMAIRQYPPFNLISIIWFYFDGIKAKKWASVQAKLLIRHGKQKNKFAEAIDGEMKKLADNSAQRNMKNPQNMEEWSWCVCLEKLSEDCKWNKSLSGLLVHILEDNALSREIVLKISHLPSKLCFPACCSFFGQSFSLVHYPLIHQPLKGVYLLITRMSDEMYRSLLHCISAGSEDI